MSCCRAKLQGGTFFGRNDHALVPAVDNVHKLLAGYFVLQRDRIATAFRSYVQEVDLVIIVHGPSLYLHSFLRPYPNSTVPLPPYTSSRIDSHP